MAQVIAKGKTKHIARLTARECITVDQDPPQVSIRNMDDTTAGDGARHEVIAGKANLSTRTTVNTFELLHACGFPVAYSVPESPTSFIAPELEMIKLEVVTRGLAWGSYLERNPKATKGEAFPIPIVEFFLKTKDRSWPAPRRAFEAFALPCDDPLMDIREKDVFLYDPHVPFVKGTYFLRLAPEEAFPISGTQELLPAMSALNRAIYETLRHAWDRVGELVGLDINMPDMKIEYGFHAWSRTLMIGDVIDAESCRLLVNGEHASKQGFREGASAEQTKLQLARAADLSERFTDVKAEVREWVRARFAVVRAELLVPIASA